VQEVILAQQVQLAPSVKPAHLEQLDHAVLKEFKETLAQLAQQDPAAHKDHADQLVTPATQDI
jgi:hypothetical protein